MSNSSSPKNTAFVILAAGESSRMGSPKQLLRWRNKSFLEHLIDKSLHSQASDTFVVLGAQSDTIANTMYGKPVHIIINDQWERGLGSSIAAAVMYIEALKKTYSGILFSLVDQLLVNTTHFDNLINAFNKGKSGIIATLYQDALGVPAVFSDSYFQELTQLNESGGAKKLIHANRENMMSIPFHDTYVDIDTPEDFAEFLKKYPDI